MNTRLTSFTSVMTEISRIVLLPKTPEHVAAFERAIGLAQTIVVEDSKTLECLVHNNSSNYAVMVAMALWNIQG